MKLAPLVTYAGFEGESALLWELFQRLVHQGEKVPPAELEGLDLPVFRRGAMLAYWDSLETAGEDCRRMPWQQGAEGERYYAEQTQELRPHAFRRLHWNLWTSNEENFLDPDQWDACVDAAHRPLLPDKSIVLDVGVNAAMRKAAGQAVAVETPRGWRISKEKSVHKIDPIIALAHAAYGCVGVLDGDFFEARRLAQLRALAPEPLQTLRLEPAPSQSAFRLPQPQAIPDAAGPLRLYAPSPQKKCRHDIGVAVADGVCCACVLRGNAVVAEIYGAMPAEVFAAQVAHLGRHYPFARIAPLVNAGGQYR